jgi:hypothetical protein
MVAMAAILFSINPRFYAARVTSILFSFFFATILVTYPAECGILLKRSNRGKVCEAPVSILSEIKKAHSCEQTFSYYAASQTAQQPVTELQAKPGQFNSVLQ